MKIANLDGKIIELLATKNGQDVSKISLTQYPKGIYFLQLVIENSVVKTKKFVVQ